MGLQCSVWDFKGHSVPLVTAEGGVGRGLEPLSGVKGIDAGSDVTSYASTASFITSEGRGFIFKNKHLGRADFTGSSVIKVLYWNAEQIEVTLVAGQNEL